MKIKLLLTVVLLSITYQSVFCQLSKSEQKIVAAIDTYNQQHIDLLKKIVDINSGTMNFDGVRKVGNLLVKEFEGLGMEAKMTSGDKFGRAGHLVASNNGKRGPKILMIGHLDTVFEPSNPFQKHVMLNDSIMKGPGVCDMKGGDVIILLTLRGLKEAGLLDKFSIQVVMTGDEEASGDPINLSKNALTQAAAWADIALAFENADGQPETIVTSRRGSVGWELKVHGNAAHSSQIFSEKVGAGAVFETARILDQFYQALSNEKYLTFNPGIIIGGDQISFDASKSEGHVAGKTNIVAQDVLVKGGLRTISLDQLNKAKATMQKIVEDNYPRTSATLTFSEGGYPPFAETPGNNLLLKIFSSASQKLGYGPVSAVNPINAGAADVSFTSGLVDMAIDGLGLSGENDHTENETGNLNMLSVQAKRSALLMYSLSKK